jgi:acetyl esterase/lipase
MSALRATLRQLAKSPGFTAVAILTLALGIGLSASSFSMANVFLLRDVPYPGADRLVRIFRTSRQSLNRPHSPDNLLDIRESATSFSAIGLYNGDSFALGEPGQPAEQVFGLTVSPGFLETLGVAPALALPGGGYNSLAAHESYPIAEHFRAAGLAAFVLQYRLRPYSPNVALLYAQRAVRLLRARAADFGLDPGKIAAVGFSAGGHLAANLSTHADDVRPDDADPVERQGSRLQSAMLIYPSLVYARIKRDTADDRALTEILKNPGLHRNVGAKTPPTFLLVGYDDDKTPYEHCLAYAARLHEAGVRFELHVLGTGSPGFGLRGRDPRLQIWGQFAVNWLTTCDFLPAPPPAVLAS